MMAIIYPTLEQAIATHKKTVEVSGGGLDGHLQINILGGVLTNIQNDDYYPTMEDKLTHLFFSACKFHCFQDGNKRISIVLCTLFLLYNGYLCCADIFIREMENVSFHVAKGSIDKNFLHEIITAILNDDFDDESLKLKMFRAIYNEN